MQSVHVSLARVIVTEKQGLITAHLRGPAGSILGFESWNRVDARRQRAVQSRTSMLSVMRSEKDAVVTIAAILWIELRQGLRKRVLKRKARLCWLLLKLLVTVG